MDCSHRFSAFGLPVGWTDGGTTGDRKEGGAQCVQGCPPDSPPQVAARGPLPCPDGYCVAQAALLREQLPRWPRGA